MTLPEILASAREKLTLAIAEMEDAKYPSEITTANQALDKAINTLLTEAWGAGRESALDDMEHEIKKVADLVGALTEEKRNDFRYTVRLVFKKVSALRAPSTTEGGCCENCETWAGGHKTDYCTNKSCKCHKSNCCPKCVDYKSIGSHRGCDCGCLGEESSHAEGDKGMGV